MSARRKISPWFLSSIGQWHRRLFHIDPSKRTILCDIFPTNDRGDNFRLHFKNHTINKLTKKRRSILLSDHDSLEAAKDAADMHFRKYFDFSNLDFLV